jgi:hypothetical protein
MKDLTLQQARSFGSFQSLRLFLDDYMLYLVEENIAQVNFALMHAPYHRTTKPSTTTSKDDTTVFYTRAPSSMTAEILSPQKTTTETDNNN